MAPINLVGAFLHALSAKRPAGRREPMPRANESHAEYRERLVRESLGYVHRGHPLRTRRR